MQDEGIPEPSAAIPQILNPEPATQVWDAKMREYLNVLQKTKPVIWTGDLNVCHLDGDVWNPDAKHIPTQVGRCTSLRG